MEHCICNGGKLILFKFTFTNQRALKMLHIKSLSQSSYVEWVALWKHYLAFYHADFNAQQADQTWARLSGQAFPHMYGFVAYHNNKAVGIVHVIEHESCWTSQPYAYLQDLYTDKMHRGQGIARQLIECVYQAAAQRQCDRVYWLTQENNEPARKLYDKVAQQTGFIQYKKSL